MAFIVIQNGGSSSSGFFGFVSEKGMMVRHPPSRTRRTPQSAHFPLWKSKWSTGEHAWRRSRWRCQWSTGDIPRRSRRRMRNVTISPSIYHWLILAILPWNTFFTKYVLPQEVGPDTIMVNGWWNENVPPPPGMFTDSSTNESALFEECSACVREGVGALSFFPFSRTNPKKMEQAEPLFWIFMAI